MASVEQPVAQPQPAPRYRPSSAATLAAAGAGTVAASHAAVTPTMVATGVQARAIGEAVSQIVEALTSFSRQRSATIVPLLQRQLVETFTHRTPDEIAKLLGREQAREREFLRRQASRIQRDMPKVLAESDMAQRRVAMGKLMSREQRYMAQREKAMTARAHSVVESLDLEEASPEGAFWLLGGAHKHTPGCLAMAGKFWPWPVLRDVISPPVHPGCPCRLISLDEAVTRGMMHPDQLPDVKDALVRARRNMALEESIYELLDDDDVAALLEAHGNQKRYAKGMAHGGEFMPSVGGDFAKAKGALRKLLPHGVGTQRGESRSRHVWLKGHHVAIPHDRPFERNIGGTWFSSPAQSTNVYRDGKLASVEGEAPRHRDLEAPAGKEPSGKLPLPETPPAVAADEHDARAALVEQIALKLQRPKDGAPVVTGQDAKAAHDALLASGFVVRPSRGKSGKKELRVGYIAKSGHELDVTYGRDTGKIKATSWRPDLQGGLYPQEWAYFQKGEEPPGFAKLKAVTSGPATKGKPPGQSQLPWEGGKGAGGYTGAPAKPYVPPEPIVHEALLPEAAAQGVIPNYDHVKLTVPPFGKTATGPDGEKYALRQGNQDHVASELLANAVYRALGVNVPASGVRHMAEPDFASIEDVPLGETAIETEGKRASSGIILRDEAGNVTVFEPKNHYGGYQHTFPKGGVEKGLTPQQNAHKELWEETGLHARITGIVGDYKGDTSVSRYYTGVLTGGTPTTGPESESIKTVPADEAEKLLNKERDKQILADLLEHPLPKGDAGPDMFPELVRVPSVLSPMVGGSSSKTIKGPSDALGAHFMADALLANWDLIGKNDANVRWDKDGNPIRLDHSGALGFRPSGDEKPFGPVPTEVWSMLSPKGQGFDKVAVSPDQKREQARAIGKALTAKKIDVLVDAAPFADEQARNDVRAALKARVAWMRRYADGKEHEPAPLHGNDAAVELTAGQSDLKLFPEEEHALNLYADLHPVLNQHLIDGKPKGDATQTQRDVVKALDGLTQHVSTDEDVTAYAGLDAQLPEDAVGKTLASKGFLNMGLDAGEAHVSPVVMRVLVPAGSHALYTRGIPDALLHDRLPDVIGARNSRLRIVSQASREGKVYVDAVMLP